MKNFKPKPSPEEDGGRGSGGGRNPPADFRGQQRSNDTRTAAQLILMHGSTARGRAWKPRCT
jgi:hypothetical protein